MERSRRSVFERWVLQQPVCVLPVPWSLWLAAERSSIPHRRLGPAVTAAGDQAPKFLGSAAARPCSAPDSDDDCPPGFEPADRAAKSRSGGRAVHITATSRTQNNSLSVVVVGTAGDNGNCSTPAPGSERRVQPTRLLAQSLNQAQRSRSWSGGGQQRQDSPSDSACSSRSQPGRRAAESPTGSTGRSSSRAASFSSQGARSSRGSRQRRTPTGQAARQRQGARDAHEGQAAPAEVRQRLEQLEVSWCAAGSQVAGAWPARGSLIAC